MSEKLDLKGWFSTESIKLTEQQRLSLNNFWDDDFLQIQSQADSWIEIWKLWEDTISREKLLKTPGIKISEKDKLKFYPWLALKKIFEGQYDKFGELNKTYTLDQLKSMFLHEDGSVYEYVIILQLYMNSLLHPDFRATIDGNISESMMRSLSILRKANDMKVKDIFTYSWWIEFTDVQKQLLYQDSKVIYPQLQAQFSKWVNIWRYWKEYNINIWVLDIVGMELGWDKKRSLKFVPSVAFDNILKKENFDVESVKQDLWQKNDKIYEHVIVFQIYLNSMLQPEQRLPVDGKIDIQMIKAIECIKRNNKIMDDVVKSLAHLENVTLKTEWWKSFLVYNNPKHRNPALRWIIAVLDIPYYDIDGNVYNVNEYNEWMESKNSKWGDTQNNIVLWIESVDENSNAISKYIKNDGTVDIKAFVGDPKLKDDNIRKMPFIMSSDWTRLTGKLEDWSWYTMALSNLMGYLMQSNTWRNRLDLRFWYEQQVDPDRLVNIKAWIDVLHEISTSRSDDKLRWRLAFIFAAWMMWASFQYTKWTEMQQFLATYGIKPDKNNVYKFTYAYFKKIVNAEFPGLSEKYLVNPAQHWLAGTWTHYLEWKSNVLREISATARWIYTEWKDMWVLKTTSQHTWTIFEQFDIHWAIRWWHRTDIELWGALDLFNALSNAWVDLDPNQEIRLDLAVRWIQTNYESRLDVKANTKYDLWMSAVLTYMFPDRKTKFIWEIHRDWDSMVWKLALNRKFTEDVEWEIAVWRREHWMITKTDEWFGWISINIKDPFWRKDKEEKEAVYPTLWIDPKRQAYLSWTELEPDRVLALEKYYVFDPVTQKIRTIYIDTSTLPNSSELEKNPDWTFKNLDLDTWVNDLTWTITSVTKDWAAFSFAWFFSVVDGWISWWNDAVRVVNFQNLPIWNYRIQAPQTSWWNAIVNMTVTQWSVKLSTNVEYATSVPNNLATALLAKTVNSVIEAGLFRTSSWATGKLTGNTANSMNSNTWNFTSALVTNYTNGTYTAKVMNAVYDGSYSAAQITQLQNGTMSNSDAEIVADWGSLTPDQVTWLDLQTASDLWVSSSDNSTNDNTPTFTWTAVSWVDWYKISTDGWTNYTDIWNVTSYTFWALWDSTYTVQVRAYNGSWDWTASSSISLEIDTSAPSALSWTGTTPDTKGAQYNDLVLSLWQSISGGSITSFTSSTWWTLSNDVINWDWNLQFDWLTPNAWGSQLRVQWTDKAWNTFDLTKNVVLPN